jgi:hypothetical protein
MAACAGAPRTPQARAAAPTVRTASVVCFDGRLNPSGSASHASAGGRSRAITRDRCDLTAAPLATIRHGAAAWRHQPWRAPVIAASASTGYAIWGSASPLTTLATLTALGRGGCERLRIPAGRGRRPGRDRPSTPGVGQRRTLRPRVAASGFRSPPCAVGAASRLPRKRRHLGEQRRLGAAVSARANPEPPARWPPPESGELPGGRMNRSCYRYRHDILLATRGEQDPLAIRLPALIARERRDPPPGGRSRHFENTARASSRTQ